MTVIDQESVAYSLAVDLLFNGQNMDYVERPMSLAAIETMSFLDNLPPRARVGIVGPGGGRLVRTLVDRGCRVEAFEGRYECRVHLEGTFSHDHAVTIRSAAYLDDPLRREKLQYDALFCMDDLRSFRENAEWTDDIQKMINPGGYLVYSQVSNQMPKKRNNLSKHFKVVGNYDVSNQTADEIRASYFGLDDWNPGESEKQIAKETLKIIENASAFRRNILSGNVEIRYFVWQKFGAEKSSSGDLGPRNAERLSQPIRAIETV